MVKHDCSVSPAAAPRFARFVPRQLVRHLLEIDREAKLGVQVREIDSTDRRGVVAAQKDDTYTSVGNLPTTLPENDIQFGLANLRSFSRRGGEK